MHDVIGFGLVLLAILAGILFNRGDIRDLRSEVRGEIKDVRADMAKGFAEVSARLDRMQADLSQFYRSIGQHEARLDNIEKRLG